MTRGFCNDVGDDESEDPGPAGHDFARLAAIAGHLCQEPFGRSRISAVRQERVEDVAAFVDGPLRGSSCAGDLRQVWGCDFLAGPSSDHSTLTNTSTNLQRTPSAVNAGRIW